MWEDFGKALTNVAFAGVGLAALAAEQVVKAGKVLAEKGEIYVEQGKRYGEEPCAAGWRSWTSWSGRPVRPLPRRRKPRPARAVPRSPRSTAAPRSTTARNHEANGQAGRCPAWPFAMCSLQL